jgi:hypothetical protein
MNGNQITISVNNDDFNQLRKIARTRGQTVSDYISCLVSSNLLNSSIANTTTATSTTMATSVVAEIAPTPDIQHLEPTVLKTARARAR